MSIDFQVVFPQQTVKLTSVRVTQNFGIPTLDVQGDDFSAVDEVTINDIEATDVLVLSKHRLLAQIPDGARAGTISSVNVLSRNLAITDRSLIRFRIGKTPSKVSGTLRLLQLFLKILLTTPGTDIFSPNLGAAALKNLGKSFSKSEGNSIVTDFVIAVSTAAKQIIALQSRDPSISRDERLLSAKVLRATYNRAEEALVVSVELTSQAGKAAVANVTV